MQPHAHSHQINVLRCVPEFSSSRNIIGFRRLWFVSGHLRVPLCFLIRAMLFPALMSVPMLCMAQDGDNQVLQKRATVIQHRGLPSSVLRLLSATSKVPIGFELIPSVSEEDDQRVTINVKSGTVKDVLDEFVKSDPRYRWEIQHGIINVLPVEANGGILDVLVSAFNVKDVDAEDVPTAIFDLPDVQLRLRALGFVGNKAVEYHGPIRGLPLFSLSMTNVTVREILNEILRRGHSKFWKISTRGNKQKQLSIWL